MKSRSVSIIKVCFFTEKAEVLFEKLSSSMPEITWKALEDKSMISQWTEDAFQKSMPLLFISAAGIAVRTIAPFVNDKLTDSPVLVMDEEGKFIIPILSGHLGNANSIAEAISKAVKAQAVITTSTDINEKFSVDTFAKINGFKIVNRDGIKKVSAKILSGEKITVYIEDGIKITNRNIPSEIIVSDDKTSAQTIDVGITTNKIPQKNSIFTINLVPKKYCLGIGCKKGKTFEELKDFIQSFFIEKISDDFRNDIFSVSSIDLKKNETGIMELAHFLHAPFITYTAEELMSANGEFSESDFVKEVTGVSNVCERAASLSAGVNGKLIIKKTSKDGMTLSVYEKLPEITAWSENFLGETR